VIRAEADVALSSPRDAAQYRDALTRIQGESDRLRRLVDDMLWLARFDSRPPPPSDEPVDLATLAQACADRFRAVGPAIATETPAGPVLISAPPEWIDRLAGVLVDNACRYAGPDGQVRIRVEAHGSRVSLTVEDTGPGIPEQERPRLFDRFHRTTDPAQPSLPPPSPAASPAPPSQAASPAPPNPASPAPPNPASPAPPSRPASPAEIPQLASPATASPRDQHSSGAGLGLAIGDSIVRSTGGRWHVGDSPLGGALMQVSWRHSQPHRTAPRLTAAQR
jgi:signal transduction histidine kinase